MYICIVRDEKRWAKALSDKRTVGTPGCHLGWTEAAICQQPPDFLCLWPDKSINKVSLLGPGDGDCKSLSILAKLCQIQKNQLCGISPLVLSIQELSREKILKNQWTFWPQRMFAVNIFLNQMNQDVLVAWLLSDVGGLENSRTHFSLSLKTNTIKLIHSLCLWIGKGST